MVTHFNIFVFKMPNLLTFLNRKILFNGSAWLISDLSKFGVPAQIWV